MNPVRISSEGCHVAGIWIPPFSLRQGEVVCLHMPCAPFSPEEDQVVEVLTGERPVPGLHLSGRVCWADRLSPRRRGFFQGLRVRLFRPPLARDWLRRATGMSRE